MARASSTNDRMYEYYLLAKDEKPVNDNISTGSVAVEIDTLKVFFYDSENSRWIEAK